VNRIDFHAQAHPFTRDIDLHFATAPRADGSRGYATNITFEHVEAGMMPPPMAALTLSQADAQRLMDELWSVGLRPSEGSGSAGAMAATQAHLQDMRKLVFKGEAA
jgi:hypothetical protein